MKEAQPQWQLYFFVKKYSKRYFGPKLSSLASIWRNLLLSNWVYRRKYERCNFGTKNDVVNNVSIRLATDKVSKIYS